MNNALNKGVKYNLSYQRAQLFRSRVSGEWRLEYKQPQNAWYIRQQYPDMMSERINFQDRYFIPNSEAGKALLEKLLQNNPVASTSGDDGEVQYQIRENSTEGGDDYADKGRTDVHFLHGSDGRNAGIRRVHIAEGGRSGNWETLTLTQQRRIDEVVSEAAEEVKYGNIIYDVYGTKAHRKIYEKIVSGETEGLKNVFGTRFKKLEYDVLEAAEPDTTRIAGKAKPQDAEYMSAVQKDDLKFAQKLVDKAAKEAGYTIRGYHGTDTHFNTFELGDIGFHIGTKEQAEARAVVHDGNIVMPLFAKIEHPLYAAFDFGDWHGKNTAVMLIETEQFEDREDRESIEDVLSDIAKMPGRSADKELRRFLKSLGYDGVMYDNNQDVEGKTDISYIAFDSSQLKSAESVVYDDKGNVIPLSELFNSGEKDIRYQQRTSPLSDREVLSIAASGELVEGISEEEFKKLSKEKQKELGDFRGKLTEGEKDALNIYRGRLNSLYELEQRRAEEGRKYREQQFGEHVDRAEAQKTLNRMKVLDTQIENANKTLLDTESKEVLRRVVKAARTVVETKEREHGKELLARYRDRRDNAVDIRKYRDRIRTDTDTLKKWILHPNNKTAYQHVPEVVKNSVIPFLTSIDFTSKQQLNGKGATKADREFVKKLKAVQTLEAFLPPLHRPQV